MDYNYIHKIDSYYLDYWANLSSTVNLPDNLHSQQDNFNLLIGFPIEEIKNKINSFDLNINDIIKKYFENHKNINKEFISVILNDTINYNNVAIGCYQFYEDLKLIDKINNGYSFLDVSTTNNKKKVGLGFGILYILYIAYGFVNDTKDNLDDLYRSNPLFLFYICGYLFFDFLLDDPTISKTTKKNVIKYINTIFSTGELYDPDDDNLIDTHYLTTIKTIFTILLNYDKEKYPFLYDSVYKMFMIEAVTSKYQTYDGNSVKYEDILKCSLLKSSFSVMGVFQICNITKDFYNDPEYVKFSSHFAFILQLADDLIDIEQDIEENNITIFSYPYIYKLENRDEYLKENISKLINYVFDFKNIIEEINIFNGKNKVGYYYMLLMLINYGISKYDNIREMFKEYESIFLFKFDEIYKIIDSKCMILL